MKYQKIKNIERESDFSYWNPPIGEEYVEQGIGYYIGSPLHPRRAGNQSLFQINLGGIITNYIINSGRIYSVPENDINATATLVIDLFTTYNMGGVLSAAIGVLSGQKVIAICNYGPGTTEQILIFSWDGNFTLINQITNPTGVSTGLHNMQWDDNSQHFYASSPFAIDKTALKINPSGSIVGSITTSTAIDKFETNCFNFLDRNTAWVKSKDTANGSWTVVKCDLNNFTIDESSVLDLRNTTNGYLNIGTIDSISLGLTKQVNNKIVNILTVTIAGVVSNIKLIFDMVSETTYWSGNQEWVGSTVFSSYFSANKNILAFNIDTSQTPILLDTSSPNMDELNIPFDTQTSFPIIAISIDDYSQSILQWSNISNIDAFARKYEYVNNFITSNPAGSIEKKFYTENSFGTIKGNVTNNTLNFNCFKVVEGTGISVTETSGNITYEETIQEVRNNSEPYLFEDFSIYANSVEQLNIQLTKISKGAAGESKTSFNYPTLLNQKQLIAINLPMNFTPKSISRMGYKVKAFESVRLIINYTKGSINKHIETLSSFIEEGVPLNKGLNQIEGKVTLSEGKYLQKTLNKIYNQDQKKDDGNRTFKMSIPNSKKTKGAITSSVDDIIRLGSLKSFGVDELSVNNIKRIVAGMIDRGEYLDPSDFKEH